MGHDHGFVYAIFTNLPGLPADLAVKVGRIRFRYGIDAVSDAPANPARNLVYKNLGMISDKGIEVSGYYGDLDYSAAALMATRTLPSANRSITTRSGSSVPWSSGWWASIR